MPLVSYIWIKDVNVINLQEDKMSFYRVENPSIVRKVIENLKRKNLGRRLKENDLQPKNPSFIKWINEVFSNLSRINNRKLDSKIEDIINEFRSYLRTRSKEIGKYIAGLLLLDSTIVIFYCKRIESVAEVEDAIKGVDRLLDPQNVYRAIVIEKSQETNYYYFFEYNYKLSRALADIFGIDYELIGFEALGNITLILNMESYGFSHKLLLPLDLEDINRLLDTGKLTRYGKIKLFDTQWIEIESVRISREKSYDFSEFYEKYILWKEGLESHRRKFNELVYPKTKLLHYVPQSDKFRYIEDERNVYEISLEGRVKIYEKFHERFLILFSTFTPPGIGVSETLVQRIKNSLFGEDTPLEIWHAGVESLDEPIRLGGISLFNKIPDIKDKEKLLEVVNSIINDQTNYTDNRIKLLTQLLSLNIIEKIFKKTHLNAIFSFISENVVSLLKAHFKDIKGFGEHENELIEFKSSADYLKHRNPTQFAKAELIPTINSKGLPKILLYGVNDERKIEPIPNLKSDMLETIEKIVKDGLKIDIKCFDFSINGGRILACICF